MALVAIILVAIAPAPLAAEINAPNTFAPWILSVPMG